MRSTRPTIATITLCLLVAGPAVPADRPAPGMLAAPAPATLVTTQLTGLRAIAAVSRTGRYVVGSAREYGIRWQLRDTRSGTRVELLPKAARSPSISDSGRFVTYMLPVDRYRRNKVMRYDRRTDRTVQVTRTSKGKVLRPRWRGSCTGARCEEDQKLVDNPQLVGGQISGNGRYVVFCANFRKPGRVDLYLKNLRTERLRRVDGLCEVRREEGDTEYVQPPTVSTDARTVLLPGLLDAYEAFVTWGPGRALVNRRELRDIGGVGNSMTRDGRTITVNGAFTGTRQESAPADSVWYDVASATSTTVSPPGLRMNHLNASSDGRYVLWRPGYGEPLAVHDRTLSVDYDLQTPLAAAGYGVPDRVGRNSGWLWGFIDTDSAMSGTGQVVFVGTDAGVVKVRWRP